MSRRSSRSSADASRRFDPAALFVFVLILLGASPVPAVAQADDSRWGVSFSATPTWEIARQLRQEIFEGGSGGTIKGSEFTIGMVRGSTRGGDWGVSFVRKPWEDGSGEIETGIDCFNQAQTQNVCRPFSRSTLSQGVYINGVQVHRFIAFATFANRAQVGLNVAGGVGAVKGHFVETFDASRFLGFAGGQAIFAPYQEVQSIEAKDEVLTYFPLIKLEAEGSVILASGLKLQVAGGFNFPSISMRIGAVYLVGAR